MIHIFYTLVYAFLFKTFINIQMFTAHMARRQLAQKIDKFQKKHYKKLVFVPAIFAIIGLLLIFGQYQRTGDFFYKGISLKGGTTVTIQTNQEIQISELENVLRNQFPDEEFLVRVLRDQGQVSELTVETTLVDQTANDILPLIEEQLSIELDSNDYSIQTIGASLSKSFFNQIIRILGLAFLLMAIVVFIYFKSFVPSIAVVLSSIFDMIITLAIINQIGVRMSTAGIAAFLMLMDYSIDMNSMLIANVLQRDTGTSVFGAIKKAFGTGITMTAAGIGAMLSAYFVTTSVIIKQIMLILVIGLVVDAITTWVQNASLMRWYTQNE